MQNERLARGRHPVLAITLEALLTGLIPLTAADIAQGVPLTLSCPEMLFPFCVTSPDAPDWKP